MKNLRTFRSSGILVILTVFLVMGAILFAERSGIRYQERQNSFVLLEADRVLTARQASENLKKTCLVLTDSRSDASVMALEQFEQIFLDMKVGCQVVDVASEEVPDFDGFDTTVILLADVSPLGEKILELSDWVYEGGRALFALTLEKEQYISLIEQKLGIISSGYENALVEEFYPEEGFMLGGGRSYPVLDAYDSAWAVELGETAEVFARTDGEKRIPLIWRNAYGSGYFVVDNFGLYAKSTRGFFAASYSLLEDACVYPVINGAAFYLDDFPSPVPGGNGMYVKRDYGMSISEFYTNVWWQDMLEMAEKHGIKYTGVMIENYEDDTSGEVTEPQDVERFQYFGNMLLHMGGEIGFHGYNHQPLSLSDRDYGDVLPYNTWKNQRAMKNAMGELIRFGGQMFPDSQHSVYVPPSNVLSEAGRRLLTEDFPQIRTIAASYFPGEFAYAQEFEVAGDGMVEQPRIISGGILNDYMRMAALSELNMHLVSSHFLHPDDLLDEDRGAALGWETLKGNLNGYMDWLYSSAPGIRSLTGTELSGAIQRYSGLTVEKEESETMLTLRLGNLYDEGYLMVRMNRGRPGAVTGGTLMPLTGNLYLLCAKESTVTIEWSR